mgnify:CR=1 FL=1
MAAASLLSHALWKWADVCKASAMIEESGQQRAATMLQLGALRRKITAAQRQAAVAREG